MNLTGRVAIITGASRGLGRHAAQALARKGAAVALVARSEAALTETVLAIQHAGGRALAIPGDVCDPPFLAAMRQRVLASLGPPTILLNAAAIFGPIQRIQHSDPAAWVDTLMVNLIGPYLLCRALANDMVAQGWGRIINVSSAAAFDPPGGLNSAYATSKVALNHFTRHLAAELAGTGVTVNAIHPGDVKTAMWADIRDQVAALGPEAEGYRTWVKWVEETGGDSPEKASALILRLLAEDAAGITGQFLWIEDGLRPPLPSW